ncbi:MAG: copper chaperone PCu(A)C [Geminicoccaceae bacterium]
MRVFWFVLGVLALLGMTPEHVSAAEEEHHDDAEHHQAEHDEAGHDAAGQDEAEHVSEANGLRAVHAWTRATDAREALVWLELENERGEPVRVTGAESSLAKNAELVGFQIIDGEGQYVPIEAIEIDAGGEIAFTPFGLAIRLLALAQPLVEGEALEVALVTDQGDLPIEVAIEASDADQHSHAGHAHE